MEYYVGRGKAGDGSVIINVSYVKVSIRQATELSGKRVNDCAKSEILSTGFKFVVV
jgi:hypothetical protein